MMSPRSATRHEPTQRVVQTPVLPATKALLIGFAALTLVASTLLLVLPDRTATLFAWTIEPPLTAAFLGAGYGSGFLLVVLARGARSWADARVALLTIGVFTVLTSAATVLHLDRFHFDSPGALPRFAAWSWSLVYGVVPVALTLTLVRQARTAGQHPARRRAIPAWLQAALGGQGLLLLVAGVALFVWPARAALLWPWPLTPLTARMVAAWLLAFGVAAGLSLVERDLVRLRTAAIAYLVFGVLQLVALAGHPEVVRWGTTPATVYLLVLLTIPPVGAAGWWLAGRALTNSKDALR